MGCTVSMVRCLLVLVLMRNRAMSSCILYLRKNCEGNLVEYLSIQIDGVKAYLAIGDG